MLFCALADAEEPGVVEPASDSVLASLAMVNEKTWKKIRKEVATAFDISMPGRWVQKGLVSTFDLQDQVVERLRKIGRIGGRRSGMVRKGSTSSS